jgi:hypothetical protein
MRKRELKSSSADYRKFRMNYLAKVDNYIGQISKFTRESDIKEVERQFQIDLENDLRDLRQELGVTRKQLLFPKEVGVAVLAAIGSFATSIVGFTDLASRFTAFGVGALIGTAIKQKAAKRKIVRSYSLSWLCLANKE